MIASVLHITMLCSQAIPQVTMVVGKINPDDDVIRVYTTASADIDGPFLVTFPVPTESNKLSAGSPAWANYVKGVVSLYPGKFVS